jgi:protein-tyrosine phosphatase
MQIHWRKRWIALPVAIMGGVKLYQRLQHARPIIFPKDAPAPEREAHRRVAFAGAHNFRDLGGYPASAGRRVKWGLLYRSDNLSKLSKRDLQALNSLGLHRLIDFRADFEKSMAPNRLPGNSGFNVVELPVFDSNNKLGQELRERFISGNLDGIDADQLLHEANRQFVTEFTPQYRAFVHEVLAAAGRPIAFHCTAGKDRTGFAAAILLRLLGVAEETIIADYLISKRYSLKSRSRDIMLARVMRGAHAATIITKLSSVEPGYLQTAFATIDQEYGSFDAYLTDGLGLSATDIETLRSTLLEQQ